jgi:hypothetical protein
MGMAAPDPTNGATTRSADRVVELRAELWRLHARLSAMDPDDPVYEDAVDEVLELTAEFLREVGERRPPRRGWLPRPRAASDERRR